MNDFNVINVSFSTQYHYIENEHSCFNGKIEKATYVLLKGKCNGCILLSLTKEVTRYICISCNVKG